MQTTDNPTIEQMEEGYYETNIINIRKSWIEAKTRYGSGLPSGMKSVFDPSFYEDDTDSYLKLAGVDLNPVTPISKLVHKLSETISKDQLKLIKTIFSKFEEKIDEKL